MQTRLDGKRALVCGSSRGIGRAAAETLAQLGARVTLLARDGEALRRVAEGLEAGGEPGEPGGGGGEEGQGALTPALSRGERGDEREEKGRTHGLEARATGGGHAGGEGREGEEHGLEARATEGHGLASSPWHDGHDWIVADFADPGAVERAVRERTAGGTTFHILVNNTGGPPAGRAIDADAGAYEEAFRRHLVCNQVLAQLLAPGMRSAGYGRIINVISTSVKQPIPNLGVSNTVRGAVASWAKTLSMELAADGITVNNVLPGFTKTDRLQGLIEGRADKRGVDAAAIERELLESVPMGRFGEPEEVAAMIAFLASPAAGYVSGQSIAVDGARTGAL